MKTIFKGKILTIPNLLSFLRLCMIPFIVWFYVGREDSLGTALLLLLSGFTDTLDGFIARRFNMISELGKALDPVADKLTQIAMMFCLMLRFPMMRWLFAVLVVKELFVGVTSLLAIQREGKVLGANWHGKITTTLLYATMILHLLWADMPAGITMGIILLCIVMIAFSGLLYGIRNFSSIFRERTEVS